MCPTCLRPIYALLRKYHPQCAPSKQPTTGKRWTVKQKERLAAKRREARQMDREAADVERVIAAAELAAKLKRKQAA